MEKTLRNKGVPQTAKDRGRKERPPRENELRPKTRAQEMGGIPERGAVRDGCHSMILSITPSSSARPASHQQSRSVRACTSLAFKLMRSASKLSRRQRSDVESILDAEIARKIQAHNDEQLREFLISDLRELNTCFAHGAYKAAIILAGSILEAVLTDWLSEIHGTNYFETDYMIEMQNGHHKRAGLSDMIDEIKELEKPDWLEEARLAHKIRKKRNLVHAALCVKAEDVSEQTAREVIEYLDKVLRTRGVRSTPQAQNRTRRRLPCRKQRLGI